VDEEEAYGDASENEGHANPDFLSNGHFSRCFQVIAQGNSHEDNCQSYEDNPNRCRTFHCFSRLKLKNKA